MVLILVSTSPSFAATNANTSKPQVKPKNKLLVKIRKDLKSHQRQSFRALLNTWQKSHGIKAVTPLMKLANYKKIPDRDRYIALMGATKIGGKAMAPRVAKFLDDQSWLMRSASLRALRVLKARKYGKSTLPLLKDKSLIVRNEAVKTIGKLKPRGSVRALIRALHDPKNYHKGKAQWVPQRALNTLVKLKPKKKAAQYLRPLLFKNKDRVFLKQVVASIESISQSQAPKGMKLDSKVQYWKKRLAPKAKPRVRS